MRKKSFGLVIVLLAAAVGGCATGAKKEANLDTDEQKTLYAAGVVLGSKLVPFNLTPAELELVQAGFVDGASGKDPRVAMETYGPKTNELWQTRLAKTAEAEKKSAQAFLEKAAAEKGAQKTESGLVYTELKAGDGPQPKDTNKVKVHYTGTLADGTVFDSSVERGQPAEFPLYGVIRCWTEGLQLMKQGGKAKLVCPPELAYGDRGSPPKIKPGAALVFEVELLEVLPGGIPGHD